MSTPTEKSTLVHPEMSTPKLIKTKGKIIEVGTERAAKLLMICRALDKEIKGLDGRRVNMLGQVRLGVSGPTMAEVYREIR